LIDLDHDADTKTFKEFLSLRYSGKSTNFADNARSCGRILVKF